MFLISLLSLSLSLSLSHSLPLLIAIHRLRLNLNYSFNETSFFLTLCLFNSLSLSLYTYICIHIYIYHSPSLSLSFSSFKMFCSQVARAWFVKHKLPSLHPHSTVQYGTVQYSGSNDMLRTVTTHHAIPLHPCSSFILYVLNRTKLRDSRCKWHRTKCSITVSKTPLFVSLLYPSCTLFPSPSTTQFFMIFRHAFLCAPIYMIRVMRNACSWQSSVEQAMHRLARYPPSADDQTDCYML